ncbi:MAG TPA: aspartyl protease family protein [Blastocatellia bacterium]|nr:aspartyl protease family protein [Blastocatellia bacterium]
MLCPQALRLKLFSAQVECKAKIDTGAQFCLFERDVGEALGIDIESGLRVNLETLTGRMIAWGHEVSLTTLGLRFDTMIYFAESYEMNRNLLGRQGWLQLVRLAIVDYEEEIYLSPYEEQI